jgi:hypothetical protein
MPRFDVGVEGTLRVNGVEAASGEAARDFVLKQLKEQFNGGVKLTRSWFQASSEYSGTSRTLGSANQ